MKPTSLGTAFISAALLLPCSAQANEQCRQISNRKERHKCYAQQDAAKASKKPKTKPSKIDSDLDRLKRENDLMTKKLRSICEGC